MPVLPEADICASGVHEQMKAGLHLPGKIVAILESEVANPNPEGNSKPPQHCNRCEGAINAQCIDDLQRWLGQSKACVLQF